MLFSNTLVLGALLPLVSAHFKLLYPVARGFDEDILGTFPCGGQNTISPNRTQFPINGAPIQLYMGHTQTNIQVLLSLGNDPGDNFNITLVPTFAEQGPQNFCLGAGAIQYPAGLNITEGMNATIQVVTNGDPSGGLYNCADITFTNTALSSAQYSADCQNSTGISVSALTGAAVNANSTTEGSSTTSASSSGTATATGSASTASSTAKASGSAPLVVAGSWMVAIVGAIAGFAAL